MLTHSHWRFGKMGRADDAAAGRNALEPGRLDEFTSLKRGEQAASAELESAQSLCAKIRAMPDVWPVAGAFRFLEAGERLTRQPPRPQSLAAGCNGM